MLLGLTYTEDQRLIIALDIGGSKIAGALWHGTRGLHEHYSQPTRLGSEDSVIQSITSVLDRLIRKAGLREGASAIGIGVPGQVDFEQGTVFSPVNLGFSQPVPLKSIVEARYGLPVFLDNDANVGAVGEAKFGAAVGLNNFIYLSLGTGIGSGIVIGGKVYRGTNGLAGEAGHVSVIADGPECACGGRGCVENLGSGRAVARRAKEVLCVQADRSSVLHGIQSKHGEVTAKDVFSAARQGDTLALTIVSEVIFYLGTLVGNLVSLLDPEAVILGGGMGQNADLLVGPLNEFLARRSNLNRRTLAKIISSSLGEDSGIIGAAALCLEEGL
jgi:glucokinase